MKRLLFVSAFILMVSATSGMAQIPVCNNQNGLEGRINAIEHQGWVETNRIFVPIYYFTVPEAPYVIGTLQVSFAVDCQPGEGCPQILMLYQEEAIQTSANSCHWQRVNLNH